MHVLVTGGAGYIGSHAVRELINSGYQVTVLDNLTKGHFDAVDPRARLILGDTSNADLLLRRLHGQNIEAVMHFAADIEVGESMKHPYRYYQNNFSHSIDLFYSLIKFGVRKIIFSSTAAVYGNPSETPISENVIRNPINPYGRSKMMTEMALEDFNYAYGISYAILRYFNVAGASPDASIGEDHHPESHLIPRILHAAHDEGEIKIFGTDYDTPDGTCIRDYVHVVDLVRAHVLALEKLGNGEARVYNLGSERGFSVWEVIRSCESVVGKTLKVIESKRRPGDPAVLVASSRKIREELNWKPLYPDIKTIVHHAWHWHSTHPLGYSRQTNNLII